jgi:hypothetical protein
MYYQRVVAIQIRNVPDDIRAALMDNAKARGQSLQAYLLDLLCEDAAWSINGEVLRRTEERLKRGGGSRLTDEERQEDIDAWKAERDARFESRP